MHPDLGLLYIPFGAIVIAGAANAVNLTDGLDGLAIGPVMIAASTYVVFATNHFSGYALASGLLRASGDFPFRLPDFDQ